LILIINLYEREQIIKMDKLMEDYRMAIHRNNESLNELEELNKELNKLKIDSMEEQIKRKIKNLNIRTRIIDTRIKIIKNEINTYK
jgi:hypothetical protein